ncbi:MAG: glycosyltransferase family 2 protein [Candidatus Binatia bacterium]
MSKILITIPAYNEETTIKDVVSRVRRSLPQYDLTVINDGSRDKTADILKEMDIATVSHACNLGYGRAVQTAIKYAARSGYDALVTLDADGQHHPEEMGALIDNFETGNWDILIGSRFIKTQNYSGSPLGRRFGMTLFSSLVYLATGEKIHDTTSGLKMIGSNAFEPLTQWHFVDFHAEALVLLLRLGYRVGEFPITVSERQHGESMYDLLSHVKYPLKTALMIGAAMIQASVTKKGATR